MSLMTSDARTYDLVVLGGGPTGITGAATAAVLGNLSRSSITITSSVEPGLIPELSRARLFEKLL